MTATLEAHAPEASAAQLREQGWCVLHDVIPPEQARRIRNDLWRCAVTCGVIAQSYNANVEPIPFYTRVSVIKDAVSLAVPLADDRVLAVVRAALGGGEPCITATTMQVHEPGTQRGSWHVGEPFDSTSTALGHLTAVFMFSPFTPENGGYLLLPASHRRGAPKPGEASAQPGEVSVTGRSGTILLTDSRLWRAVAANDSDVMRLSVTAGYTAANGDSKKWPHDPKSVLAERIFKQLPDRTQNLLRHWL